MGLNLRTLWDWLSFDNFESFGKAAKGGLEGVFDVTVLAFVTPEDVGCMPTVKYSVTGC